MNFINEDTRLEFHKANTMMQMLAQAFESMCFQYGSQVEVINVIDANSSVLKVELADEYAIHVLKHFNAIYGRLDDDPSLVIVDPEESLWLIHGDSGNSLAKLI